MTTFTAGQSGSLVGVDWRVVQGRKSPSDLRLDIRAVRFVPVSMALGFLMADFFTQNERVLAREGYLAAGVADHPGDRYVHFITGSQRLGWEAAFDQLMAEREAKRAA